MPSSGIARRQPHTLAAAAMDCRVKPGNDEGMGIQRKAPPKKAVTPGSTRGSMVKAANGRRHGLPGQARQ